jgi:hypothetical protein
MRPPALPLACIALAILLTGCAADTSNYPSLARRPAERVTGSAEPAQAEPAPAPPALPSPELTARLAQLTAEAESAHRDFLARRDRAGQLVAAARGAAVASESWSIASIALAELEAARSRAMIALADLDSLYAAERVAGGPAAAVGAAREQVIALVSQEDAVLAELRGRLPA